MWEIITIPALLVAGGLLSLRSSRRIVLGWQDAALDCGLQVGDMTWWPRLRLEASDGPIKVAIEHRSKAPDRIVVSLPRLPGFLSVWVRPERFWTKAREIEIGDERFDAMFSIEGPMRAVCVLLDADVRRLLIRVNGECLKVVIADGEISTDLIGHPASILPLLLDISRRFLPPFDVAKHLAENAHRDSEEAVRLANLGVLAREFPTEPATVEALRLACSDPSPQVRLRAAKELGAEGRSVIQKLAEGLEEDDTSAQAVSILDLPFERLRSILTGALRKRLVRTARACLEALGRGGAVEAVSVLAEVLVREQGELAAAAALALGTTGSEAAEPPLIAALQRENPEIQVAAASSLGRVGSPAAVLPLKDATEGSSRDFRRAARQAIAEIQSRVPGASPGQLSLAGTEAGQLSLAEAEAGQLSIAADPTGELSLSPSEEDGGSGDAKIGRHFDADPGGA